MEQSFPSFLAEDSKFSILIQRDLPRTFPLVEQFKDPNGKGQQDMYNILKAYSRYDQEVGYCQGV
jgi:hypothetical protein